MFVCIYYIWLHCLVCSQTFFLFDLYVTKKHAYTRTDYYVLIAGRGNNVKCWLRVTTTNKLSGTCMHTCQSAQPSQQANKLLQLHAV